MLLSFTTTEVASAVAIGLRCTTGTAISSVILKYRTWKNFLESDWLRVIQFLSNHRVKTSNICKNKETECKLNISEIEELWLTGKQYKCIRTNQVPNSLLVRRETACWSGASWYLLNTDHEEVLGWKLCSMCVLGFCSTIRVGSQNV